MPSFWSGLGTHFIKIDSNIPYVCLFGTDLASASSKLNQIYPTFAFIFFRIWLPLHKIDSNIPYVCLHSGPYLAPTSLKLTQIYPLYAIILVRNWLPFHQIHSNTLWMPSFWSRFGSRFTKLTQIHPMYAFILVLIWHPLHQN